MLGGKFYLMTNRIPLPKHAAIAERTSGQPPATKTKALQALDSVSAAF